MGKSTDPGGNKGASMGGLEKSPARRKREADRRRREEEVGGEVRPSRLLRRPVAHPLSAA